MIHVRHSAIAAVPLDVAFAYIDDYRTVPDWMFGVSEFNPTGEFDQGLESTFDATIHIGPSTLRSRLEVTEWERDRVITLASLDGSASSSTWEFTPLSEARTEISVDFAYRLPGGLAGKALGLIVEPFIETAVKNSEVTLRNNLEELYSNRAPGSR
ncbi:polyketide cyclase [Rhodococcus sp. WMMA185]|uniref:SRPBCC family protein n=1 Tax=Rhodococcus sp. WMMA185 TaxID=679318 RepID=UPI000878743F|nr:SRPBCC family protein [Rhodococcus sp. WMMA185]AOW91641.1 polyketide cyclase [Rhodococcus sp. WMMA185]